MKAWLLTQAWKYLVAAGVFATVTELTRRSETRFAALVLSLPFVSIIAFLLMWERGEAMLKISAVAKDTLILVPLGLPFFVPLAFAGRWGLGFWGAFVLGVVLASICIGLWMWLGPKTA